MEKLNKKTQIKDLEGPLEEEETCVFARPLGKEKEEPSVSLHPSGKESEADVSDCSLTSTASTASGARKRRQPYLCKPGTAKKPAVNEADLQDPFEATPATRGKKNDLPTKEDIQQELETCTSVELRVRVSEYMSTIDKIADSSRNLRGTQAQTLRLATRSTLAATSVLTQRIAASDVGKLQRENDELLLELTKLKSQLSSLTAEVSCLRQREYGTGSRTKQGEDIMADKDPLVGRIATMIDQKLAIMRAEIFLEERNGRPSLGKDSDTASKLKAKVKKKRKAKMQESKDAQPPQVPDALLIPPGRVEPDQQPVETWATVSSRKAKTASSNTRRATESRQATNSSGLTKKGAKAPPSPKNAAVTITLTESATVGYAAAMAAAKQQINLAECGIAYIRQKKAITGGLVLEVPGPDSAKKADALAERLRLAVANMGVRIGRPVRTGELRVMDLDESITKEEVVAAIAEAGECSPEEVKVGDIRLNTFRLGTAWVRCPLTTIHILAEKKHLQVGWVSARYEILASRPLQCYRCLEAGHVRKQCSNPEDRSQLCYNCGKQGHKARECKAQAPKCPLCMDLGQPADHRLGGGKCNPPIKKITNRGLQVPVDSKVSKTSKSVNQPAEEATKTQHSTS